MERLLAHPKVVALGEIGLDYHYDNSPRDQQRAAFVEQMRLACGARKPIVIHTREAWADTWRLIEEHWQASGLGGIFHCFSGGPLEARRALDMGFYLAFGGIVTFPNAASVREAAIMVPLDRLLVETDAPYLAPASMRGRRNEPSFVATTAQRLAELRGESFDALAAATSANFERLCLPRGSGNG
jgi:TatD DNase family protein